MRKFLAVLFVCMLALPLAAQIRTGNIYGTVVDDEGNPLPGVSVTLSGPTTAPVAAVTSAAGKFRFLSLFPGNQYEVRAEIAGFKTKVETGVIVNMGVTAEITVVMEVGALEEEITVIAATPVVTPKRTMITHTANLQMLQSLPSARDPWVILQMLPGILVDRENVGGSESGQQASFVSKGETTDSWVMDGINITDMSSISSPTYFDFDMFEEISVTTGMTDIEHRERSIVVSFVSKRGGNKFSFGGRFFLTDSYFQGKPSGTDFEDVRAVFHPDYPELNPNYSEKAGYCSIRDIKDFGFNMGGPLIKDKVWWWGSYGVQQIKTTVITGGKDDTFLNNMAGKLNFQLIEGNRAEIFIHAGDKKKYGRDTTSSNPAGRNQHGKYHWGSPIFKLQDEHMFGDNLFLSARYGFTDAGFGLWPGTDEEMKNPRWYDYTNGIYNDPWGNLRYSSYFFSGRPHQFGVVQAIYYLDDLFGTSHEIKIGAELNNNQRSWVGGYGGNVYFRHGYYNTQFDWNVGGTVGPAAPDGIRDIPPDGFRRLDIGSNDLFYEDGTDRTAFYFQDIISMGRLNFNLQLRVDKEVDYAKEFTTRGLYLEDVEGDWHDNFYEIAQTWFSSDTQTKISNILTERTRPFAETPDAFKFWTISPRVGITFDVFGDGKTIAKAAFAVYPGGPLSVGNWTQSGVYPWIRFWWGDQAAYGGNGDNVVDWNELWWADHDQSARPVFQPWDAAGNWIVDSTIAENTKGRYWGGYDWDKIDADPTDYLSENYGFVDPAWKHHLDYDMLFSIEREIFADFGVGIDFTYRWDSRRSWGQSYYPQYDNAGELTTFGTRALLDPADSNYFPPAMLGHIRDKDDYMIAGQIPDEIVPDTVGEYSYGTPISTLEAAGRDWWVRKDNPENGRTDYHYDTNRPDTHSKYWGIDFRWNKRFSNRWMLSGSFTYQMQKNYYGEGYTNPTNMWAFDKQMYTNSMGGSSGKISVPMFSRWMFKLQGMYALPYGFNVSMSLSGREGMLVDEWFYMFDTTLPNSRSQSASIEMRTNETEPRLPTMWVLNLKLEKMLSLGDTGKVWISCDAFNALNNQTMNRQRTTEYGDYYVNYPTPRYYPSTRIGEPNESLNPLVLRFGIRFQF
ncbi:MAG: carboxypeptidase regulatory-like domain-containing protein [Candidatus Aminicenantes bacterium]|nr:carboxypeptidase regulatory-like domain-containing protein [Candidatus Aminicenantes bacterium]